MTTFNSLSSPLSDDGKLFLLNETNCTTEVLNYVPSCLELFQILALNGWIILGFSTSAFIAIIALFVANLNYVLKNLHPRFKFATGIVLSVHPILALCMYLEILFPKANGVLDAIVHLWFVLCMFHFFNLTMLYYGGEKEFAKAFKGTVLPWRSCPCCFWPCVWPCLPSETANQKQVRMLKILVLQQPFVQCVCTIIGMTLYIEKWDIPKRLSFSNAYMYLYAITNLSFVFALWAFIVCFRAARGKLRKFKYYGKVYSFQLTLIFVRLQSIILNTFLIPLGVIPCIPPLSPTIYGNLVLSSLILGQMTILSVMAYHFYRLSKGDHKNYVPKSTLTNGGPGKIYYIYNQAYVATPRLR